MALHAHTSIYQTTNILQCKSMLPSTMVLHWAHDAADTAAISMLNSSASWSVHQTIHIFSHQQRHFPQGRWLYHHLLSVDLAMTHAMQRYHTNTAGTPGRTGSVRGAGMAAHGGRAPARTPAAPAGLPSAGPRAPGQLERPTWTASAQQLLQCWPGGPPLHPAAPVSPDSQRRHPPSKAGLR